MIARSAAHQIKYYVLAVSEWFSHGLDPKRSAANTTGNGLPRDRITWKAPKQRPQHVGRQRCGLQFLPYAIYWVHDTNPFDKFGSCCDARINALQVG